MAEFIAATNLIISIFAVLVQVLVLIIIVAIFAKKMPAALSPILSLIAKRALLIAFLAALFGTIGSLIYSEIIGFEPCKLCWIQRIFLFPQVLILGIALVKKDNAAKIYGAALSLGGALFAAIHYIGGLGLNPLGLNCLAGNAVVSCSKNFVMELGYINIPMMSFTAFAFIASVLFLSIKRGEAAEQI